MATQVPVTLVNGGGALTPLQIKRTLCKAFREAVKDYCTAPPGSRGSFNDKFFEKLRNVTPHGANLAGSIAREAPVLAAKTAGMASGSAQALASPSNPVAQALHNAYVQESRAILGSATATSVTGAFTGGVASCFAIGRVFSHFKGPFRAFNAIRQAGYRLGWPDGMIGEQVIEIKGPADSFRKNQKETFDAVSKPNPPIVVDCKSCGANCKNGPKKKLKGKWKTNLGCP